MKKKSKKENMAKKISFEDMFKAVVDEAEERRIEENIGNIDEKFRELQVVVGRPISEEEQAGVLDIVDKYTPKDEQGNYLGDLLPFDYAWHIYCVKNK